MIKEKIMKKNYEILAPVGSMETLHAAVQNGADAVYLAGRDFGARKFANNFSNEELIEAINYCHIRGVNVFVTVNTIVFNEEMEKLIEFLDFLYMNHVDAVIVQDMGVLNLVRKRYPDLEIHCSTQMSVQTVEDIKYLETLGVTRVVLGREMTVEDIRIAKNETNVELEVFVHGALCISVSGQCLMSSLIGGRSGNRGSCAQPCRQKYTLTNLTTGKDIHSSNGDYLISPKDLMTVEQIGEIIEAGAYSLKIEGRMKKPEYVAASVKSYSEAVNSYLDGEKIDSEKIISDLSIFNRGFTGGHLFSKVGDDLMSRVSPSNQGYEVGEVVEYDQKAKRVKIKLIRDLYHNDEIQIRNNEGTIGARVEVLKKKSEIVKICKAGEVCSVNFKHDCRPGEKVFKTYDEETMKNARNTYHKDFRSVGIDGKAVVKLGEQVELTVTDGINTVAVKSDTLVEKAINRALEMEQISGQITKLGGTPYEFNNLIVELDEGISVPMKVLNELRRKAIGELDEKRIDKYSRSILVSKEISDKTSNDCSNNDNGSSNGNSIKVKGSQDDAYLTLTASSNTFEQGKALIDMGVEIIYHKDFSSLDALVAYANEKEFNGAILPEMFRALDASTLESRLDKIRELGLTGILAGSYGAFGCAKGLDVVVDFNMNIVNDITTEHYLNYGVKRVTVSPELTLEQIKGLSKDLVDIEIIGYGYMPAMIMKYCPIATTLGKGIKCGLCYNENYGLKDKTDAIFPLIRRDNCMIEVYNSKILLLIEYYRDLIKAGVRYFRLNFINESSEEVREIIKLHESYLNNEATKDTTLILEKIKANGVTKGHLHRGVL